MGRVASQVVAHPAVDESEIVGEAREAKHPPTDYIIVREQPTDGALRVRTASFAFKYPE